MEDSHFFHKNCFKKLTKLSIFTLTAKRIVIFNDFKQFLWPKAIKKVRQSLDNVGLSRTKPLLYVTNFVS